MVNGAGLAMATMDIIKLYGGEPANFLDVGGGATKEKVTAAFKIITADPNVKGILVNIFGGIMSATSSPKASSRRCKEVGLKVPLVVRLEGTNVELGKKILAESGLNVISGRRSRRRRAEDRQSREGGRIMSILVNKNTKVICQGFTGKNGTFHSEQAHRLRHQDGRRHVAGQRRHDASRPAGVRHRRRSGARRPAPTPP